VQIGKLARHFGDSGGKLLLLLAAASSICSMKSTTFDNASRIARV
jgi:hypothetical protein